MLWRDQQTAKAQADSDAKRRKMIDKYVASAEWTTHRHASYSLTIAIQSEVLQRHARYLEATTDRTREHMEWLANQCWGRLIQDLKGLDRDKDFAVCDHIIEEVGGYLHVYYLPDRATIYISDILIEV